MTNETLQQQLKNDSVLASCDGNIMFYEGINKRSRNRYCPSCDCIDTHACLICEQTIEDEDVCIKHKGLCYKCWSEKED